MALISPRLPTSKTSTDVPKDFLAKVRGIFEKQFDIEAGLGEFIVEGRIFPNEIVLRLGYVENGRLKQINFEASMDLRQPKASDDDGTQAADTEGQASSTLTRFYTLIDALGSLMEEYFEADSNEEEMDLSLHWREYDFEGEAVFMQYSTVNTRLEEEANRILGLLGEEGLVHEATPNDDALANAEVDSELAFEIQKAIRSGEYKDPRGGSEPEELN